MLLATYSIKKKFPIFSVYLYLIQLSYYLINAHRYFEGTYTVTYLGNAGEHNGNPVARQIPFKLFISPWPTIM